MGRFKSIIVLGGLLLAACGGGAETPTLVISDPTTPIPDAPVDGGNQASSSGDSQVPVETEAVVENAPDIDAVRAIAQNPCSLTPEAVIDDHRDLTVAGELVSETGTDAETGAVTGICSYWEQYRLTVFVPPADFDIEGAFNAQIPVNNTELDAVQGTAYWGFDTLTLYVLRDGYWLTIENLDTTDESPLVAPRALFTIAERRLPSP